MFNTKEDDGRTMGRLSKRGPGLFEKQPVRPAHLFSVNPAQLKWIKQEKWGVQSLTYSPAGLSDRPNALFVIKLKIQEVEF